MTAPTIVYGTRCQVYVQPSGTGAQGESFNFAARITEINSSAGDRDAEEIKTLGNNEITRELPQSPKEVEISYISTDPVFEEAVMGGSQAFWEYWKGTGWPIVISGDASRVKYRIVVQGSGAAADDWMERRVWSDSFGISHEDSVSADGYMEGTLRFKCKAEKYNREWTGSYTTNAIGTLASY